MLIIGNMRLWSGVVSCPVLVLDDGYGVWKCISVLPAVSFYSLLSVGGSYVAIRWYDRYNRSISACALCTILTFATYISLISIRSVHFSSVGSAHDLMAWGLNAVKTSY